MLIYKILLRSEWDQFNRDGEFVGSPLDVRSGFVHCSSRSQLVGTARRFFADETDLIVVALDADKLAGSLRWEHAPDGDAFPHVYGPLPPSAVVNVHQAPDAAQVARILRASEACVARKAAPSPAEGHETGASWTQLP